MVLPLPVAIWISERGRSSRSETSRLRTAWIWAGHKLPSSIGGIVWSRPLSEAATVYAAVVSAIHRPFAAPSAPPERTVDSRDDGRIYRGCLSHGICGRRLGYPPSVRGAVSPAGGCLRPCRQRLRP